MYEVAILMGSASDWHLMLPAYDMLKQLGVDADMKILSAHRTPEDLYEYVRKSTVKIFIAGAGSSAHLSGAIASLTIKPVIAVPLSNTLGGIDSLLSVVQMPRSVPVAVVGINSSTNAALLAAQILAINSKELSEKLIKYKNIKAEEVRKTDKDLRKTLDN